jgi:hypothetical protein
VLVGGFTHPSNKFVTPYPVITPALVRQTIERIPGFGRHAAAPGPIAHASR